MVSWRINNNFATIAITVECGCEYSVHRSLNYTAKEVFGILARWSVLLNFLWHFGTDSETRVWFPPPTLLSTPISAKSTPDFLINPQFSKSTPTFFINPHLSKSTPNFCMSHYIIIAFRLHCLPLTSYNTKLIKKKCHERHIYNSQKYSNEV